MTQLTCDYQPQIGYLNLILTVKLAFTSVVCVLCFRVDVDVTTYDNAICQLAISNDTGSVSVHESFVCGTGENVKQLFNNDGIHLFHY